jgi:hypothetical protein
MKRSTIVLAFGLVFVAGLALGAANPFNPTGSFGQSYFVIVDPATGNPVNVVNGALQTVCN